MADVTEGIFSGLCFLFPKLCQTAELTVASSTPWIIYN